VTLPASADDALRLAVADVHAFESQPAVLGRDAFRKSGIALTIIPMHGGTDALQAVLSGSADLATGVDTATALRAFINGAPVRVLLPGFTGASDLYWYVKADSPIGKFPDATDAHTVGFSTNGSLTYLIVTDFARELKIRARPLVTGSPAATLTDVMSGKADIGFARAPFGLKEVDEAKIRIIAQGGDIVALKSRTLRVMVVNAEAWRAKRAVLTRFAQAWRGVIDTLHDSGSIGSYAQSVHLPPDLIEKAARNAFPKSSLQADRLEGIDEIVSDAVRRKIVASPPGKDQLAEFVVIPARQ
jgi:NitT/TauT family transport system substrate-binding protein